MMVNDVVLFQSSRRHFYVACGLCCSCESASSSSPLGPHLLLCSCDVSLVEANFNLELSSLPSSLPDKPLQGTSSVTPNQLSHIHTVPVSVFLNPSPTSHKRPTQQPSSNYYNATNRHSSSSGGLQSTQLLGYVAPMIAISRTKAKRPIHLLDKDTACLNIPSSYVL